MDAVCAHRFTVSQSLYYKRLSYVFGTDLSKAFDTIIRSKLMEVLSTFLDNDDLRMISVLLSKTSMKLQFNRTISETFDTNVGVPQGDSLSPVLFVIYLEAAMRDLSESIGTEYHLLPSMIAYADDCNFNTTNLMLVDTIQADTPDVLSKWNLKMNSLKSEFTHIERRPCRNKEHWRHTQKLGSLLGDFEDVSRGKQLGRIGLKRLWKI